MHSRATGGELFRVIAIEPLPEEKAREVVYQIVDGVQHLHTLNIVHLDLKVRVWGAWGVRESANSDSLLRGRIEMPPQLGRLLMSRETCIHSRLDIETPLAIMEETGILYTLPSGAKFMYFQTT